MSARVLSDEGSMDIYVRLPGLFRHCRGNGDPVSARVEAAVSTYFDEVSECSYETAFLPALTAADEVMFSEAAIERAAKVLWDREMQAPWSSVADGFKQPFINEARAVVAALREEA